MNTMDNYCSTEQEPIIIVYRAIWNMHSCTTAHDIIYSLRPTSEQVLYKTPELCVSYAGVFDTSVPNFPVVEILHYLKNYFALQTFLLLKRFFYEDTLQTALMSDD